MSSIPLAERVKRALHPLGSVRRLVLAQWQLLRTRRMCRVRPVGSLVKISAPVAEARGRPDLVEARTWALAVSRASRHGLFRPTCLIRSLALVALLERVGIRGASVRAGVRQQEDRFLAHAWVELEDTVLTDSRDYVAQFEPWADLRIFEEAR